METTENPRSLVPLFATEWPANWTTGIA